MTPKGPWMLEVPFVSAPKMHFTEEIVNTVANWTVHIKPDTDPYSRFVIDDLATIEQARDQFEGLKRAALATSLIKGCGIRIESDLDVVENDTDQLPAKAGRPFVCRQGRDLSRLVLIFDEPEYLPSRVLPDVLRGLEIAMTSRFAVEALRDKRVALGCDLYTASYFERSVPARFISLIGVLEVLKEQDSVSAEAILLVDNWLGQLDQLEAEEANSFLGQLSYMKQVSISRGIRRVVTRHLGEERAREAQKLYGIRSNLVHNGEHPADLGDSLEHTQVIVRKLLVKILQAGKR